MSYFIDNIPGDTGNIDVLIANGGTILGTPIFGRFDNNKFVDASRGGGLVDIIGHLGNLLGLGINTRGGFLPNLAPSRRYEYADEYADSTPIYQGYLVPS